MKINYNNKRFRPVSNSDNASVSNETTFLYHQSAGIVTAEYHGGEIVQGHLLALVNDDGCLDMRYHQVNRKGDLQTGICHSTPEILPDGRIRLHESWQWTSGDLTEGHSVIEEVRKS